MHFLTHLLIRLLLLDFIRVGSIFHLLSFLSFKGILIRGWLGV
jgi:hypothetical protein